MCVDANFSSKLWEAVEEVPKQVEEEIHPPVMGRS